MNYEMPSEASVPVALLLFPTSISTPLAILLWLCIAILVLQLLQLALALFQAARWRALTG